MNGWLLTTLADQGFLFPFCFYFFLGGVVISMMAGSNSLMECAMHCGRSVIAFEINGLSVLALISSFLATQFAGGKRRMQDCWGDLERSHSNILSYWAEHESAYYSPFVQLVEVFI
jgi:hypothetical protein